MGHRLTGILLSVPLYLFGFAYLAAPTLGWHLETQSMVAAVASWPLIAKITAKAYFAFPFFFHAINGVRHLSWDFGVGFKNKTVIQTGFTTVGLAAALGLYYTFLG
jgi:succinate dehydrogenase (ubiquinone) cytochrome b560 subunit